MSDEYSFAIVGGALPSAGNNTALLERTEAERIPLMDEKPPEAAEERPATSEDPEPEYLRAPKPKKLTKKRFEKELERLRGEWKEFENAVAATGTKLVVLVEGRDAGRPRGIVSRIAEFADPRVCRVARVDAPGPRERSQWFLQPYVIHLPAAGEVAIFDGGWYARAALDRAAGIYSENEYLDVLHSCAAFERILARSGVVILKYWLSVEGDADEFLDQLANLARRWNANFKGFAELDYGSMREGIFAHSNVEEAPWNLVTHADRRELRLDFVRRLTATMAGAIPAAEPAPAPPSETTLDGEHDTGDDE